MGIQAGGEVNQKDERGWTPLHHASQYGHVEVITALLATGADKTIEDEDGETPHDVVKNQDTWNALNADGTVALGLHQASRIGNLEVVNSLIQAGGEVNTQKKWGYTPLHSASLYGHVEVVERLIQAGGDVNTQRSSDGWTPLHLASYYGHVEVITALLAAGADKTLKNKNGHTPHDYAKKWKYQDCMNALE